MGDQDDALAWQNAFRKSRFISAVDHVQLDRLRRLAMMVMDALFRHVNLVIRPSLNGPILVITNVTGAFLLVFACWFFQRADMGSGVVVAPPAGRAKPASYAKQAPHSICP